MPEYDITAGTGTFDLAAGGRIDAGLAFNAVQVDSIPIRSVRWIKGRGRGELELQLAGFLAGAPEPMTLDLRVDLSGDSAFGLRLAGVAGRVRFRKGSDVILSDVVLTLPDGGTITAAGFVHPGDLFDIDLVAATGDWSQLSPIIAIPGLRGDWSAPAGSRPSRSPGGSPASPPGPCRPTRWNWPRSTARSCRNRSSTAP
jgi:hypothetical protein